MGTCFYCDETDGHMGTCVRLVDDEIARLRTALAEAERDLANLKEHCRTEHQMRVEAEAERDERGVDLVWAAENGVQVCDDGYMLWDWFIDERGDRSPRKEVGYDDLCRAIREARRGE